MKETIAYGDTSKKAQLRYIVHLQHQTQEVVKCEVSGKLMLNIDADEIHAGDLQFLKRIGLTISNPETDRPIALGEEYRTFGARLASWLEDEEDDDDSSFFSSGSFGGSRSGGGFSSTSFGGFGGFGGGSFSGGGASRGF